MDPSAPPSAQEEVGQATLLGPWHGLMGQNSQGAVVISLTADWPLDLAAGAERGACLRMCQDSQLAGWDHGTRGYTRSEGLPRSLSERPLCGGSVQLMGCHVGLPVFPRAPAGGPLSLAWPPPQKTRDVGEPDLRRVMGGAHLPPHPALSLLIRPYLLTH